MVLSINRHENGSFVATMSWFELVELFREIGGDIDIHL